MPMRVECQECPFKRTIDPDDDDLPADIVVEHGNETGHKLEVESLDDGE